VTEPAAQSDGRPLAGLRVLALEQAVAAPLCTRHLADLGADVIKIERPGEGDFARHYDGVVHGESAYFVWLNQGKRSVVLDVAQPDGRRAVGRLLDRADVFVHNLGPGAADRLGLDHGSVRATRPTLVSCAISTYGPDGPYGGRKGFDLLVQGESGLISVTGAPDAPAKVGISIADIAAGMYALSAVLAALHRRTRTGNGAAIDVALLDCLAEWMSVPGYQLRYGGSAPVRAGMRHSSIVPYGPYRTADGMVNVAVQNNSQWRRFCQLVIERPELAEDLRFSTNELRVRNRTDLEALIEGALAMVPADQVEDRLAQADVPFGRLNDVQGLLDHEQLLARDRWWDVSSPTGVVRTIRPPFNIDASPTVPGAVPALGEHTAQVLEEIS
jgi:crotonobetainyl-CoA:carnitine CoA-transferase CaiB-like acyl-CoA transferase